MSFPLKIISELADFSWGKGLPCIPPLLFPGPPHSSLYTYDCIASVKLHTWCLMIKVMDNYLCYLHAGLSLDLWKVLPVYDQQLLRLRNNIHTFMTLAQSPFKILACQQTQCSTLTVTFK